MVNFKEFLNEKLITLGNKRTKYNQIVIMAGGAGSGKGFVQKKLLGIEGKVFDVDKLKELSLKSIGIKKRVQDEFGIDISTLNLKKEKDVSTLHKIISTLKLDKKVQKTLMSNISGDNKPNLIFDVTMKELSKLVNISESVQDIGYKKEDIHIVWVINDLDTALQQNQERSRKVKQDILINTHELVSYTIASILKKGTVQKYMDGDFWFVFNKKFSDSVITFSDNGGFYVKEVVYFKAKEKNKSPMSIKDIGDEYIDKIKKYVPDSDVWN